MEAPSARLGSLAVGPPPELWESRAAWEQLSPGAAFTREQQAGAVGVRPTFLRTTLSTCQERPWERAKPAGLQRLLVCSCSVAAHDWAPCAKGLESRVGRA